MLFNKHHIRVFFICIFLITNYTLFASIKIRRVCNTGSDNQIFFGNDPFSCSKIKISLNRRTGTTGPFNEITSAVPSLLSLIDVGANSLGVKDYYYYVSIYDSCSSISYFSDTQRVDDVPPNPTYLDSVSVLYNQTVAIGWRLNNTPDFEKFILYKSPSAGVYTPINGSGSKDTNFIDLTSNPKSASVSYDINTFDSCGKFQPFGNLHSTIFLSVIVDTCLLKYTITWSKYVGWTMVRRYYIFMQINSSPFNIIDSTSGTNNSISKSFSSGDTFRFFVRGIKDTSILVSSTSNIVSFNARKRTDPKNTEILSVSTDPHTNLTSVYALKKADEEASKIVLHTSTDGVAWTPIAEEVISNQSDSIISFKNIIECSGTSIGFKIYSFNLCDIKTHETPTSKNIILSSISTDSGKFLFWNPYSFWPLGVEKTIIFKGTGSSYANISFRVIDTIIGSRSTYLDKSTSVTQNTGDCYFLMALNKYNWGAYPDFPSISNRSCALSGLTVFVPTAFRPSGSNSVFLIRGNEIDYQKSSLVIYDRWGGVVFSTDNVSIGWDGKDKTGNFVPSGCFFYKLFVTGLDGKTQTKSGTVTLLD